MLVGGRVAYGTAQILSQSQAEATSRALEEKLHQDGPWEHTGVGPGRFGQIEQGNNQTDLTFNHERRKAPSHLGIRKPPYVF